MTVGAVVLSGPVFRVNLLFRRADGDIGPYRKGISPMRSTKFWLILTGTVLALSLAASLLLLAGGNGAATALVYQDGVCVRSIDLSQVEEPYSFTVEWEDGYNIIEVERGRIRVSEADCPDRICVRRGWMWDSAAPIACLPHRLVIQLEGGGDSGIDGVAG